MCLGVPPSCGVHSALKHHVPARGRVAGQNWYAKGCHACDALAAEYGEPTITDREVGSPATEVKGEGRG